MNKKAVGLLIGSGLVLLLCFLAALGTAMGSPKTLIGKTFIVNSTSDTDDGSCGPFPLADCTLREAINAANANVGPDTIEFNIDTLDPGYNGMTGTWTISITLELPTLTDDGTTIDGSSQAVYIGGDPNPDGPEIEIEGVGMSVGHCLTITGANSVIHGLVINRCHASGILISGGSATTNTISGNYIGSDATGSSDLGNGSDGVAIDGGAQNNVIGGDTSGERNIISGNDKYGVSISGSGTDGNIISGNYIGTDKEGSSDLGNAWHGLYIYDGAQNNAIGGNTSGERNIISGNDYDGVHISGSGTDGNIISGNYIGTDREGSSDLGNGWSGVAICGGAQNNTIGGATEGERNIVSGNAAQGVYIWDSETDGNTVSGNYIGTDKEGSSGLGNAYHGVAIEGGAQNNIIGGDTSGERNIISGNDYYGVFISGSGTMSNTISGNYIGTDKEVSSGLGNGYGGVLIYDGAQDNTVGGNTPGERNIIAFNGLAGGVRVDGLGGVTTTGNTITQNSIHSNVGLGIELVGGGNTELPPPAISDASCVRIFGTAPATTAVEVFTGPDDEGKTYLTTISADGYGDWSAWGPFTLDTYVTATATDASGNTSQFSVEVTPGTCYQIFLPLMMKNY